MVGTREIWQEDFRLKVLKDSWTDFRFKILQISQELANKERDRFKRNCCSPSYVKAYIQALTDLLEHFEIRLLFNSKQNMYAAFFQEDLNKMTHCHPAMAGVEYPLEVKKHDEKS